MIFSKLLYNTVSKLYYSIKITFKKYHDEKNPIYCNALEYC